MKMCKSFALRRRKGPGRVEMKCSLKDCVHLCLLQHLTQLTN